MRQQFQMSFDLGNEAFDDPQKRRGRIAMILRETAGRVADEATSGGLYDVNGNHVGNWGFDEIEDIESVCATCGESTDVPDALRCYCPSADA